MRTTLAATLLAVAILGSLGEAASADSTGYRVRPGDTLGGIAAAHGLTIAALAKLNGLDPAKILPVGIDLRLASPLPETGRYRVQSGDTLSGIAVRYGTNVRALARLNRLNANGLLLVGQRLLVPRRASAAQESTGDTGSEIQASIRHWAAHYGVSARLALAVAWTESGYRPNLTSSAGAWGVMQVMPVTWAYTESMLIGEPIAHTTDGGIRVGIAYLHHLLRTFSGDWRLALAGYLQGEQSVRDNGILPSSHDYVYGTLART